MSVYGLKIVNPHDGTSFIFNEKTAPASLVWLADVSYNTPGARRGRMPGEDQWTCPVKIPSGYKSMVACDEMVGLVFEFGDSHARLDRGEERIIYSQNGDTVTITDMSMTAWNGDPRYTAVKILAYPENRTGRAGLKIGNNTNFNIDVPRSGFSYVSHKAKLKIDGELDFSQIDPRLNRSNCLVFFCAETPYAIMTPGENSYTCCDRRNGNKMSAVFWLVIFSDIDATGRFENDRYGLRLRNNRGDITFSSGVGVLTKPTEIYINSYGKNERIPVSGIERPMYIPSHAAKHFWMSGRKGRQEDLAVGNYDSGSICVGVSSSYDRYGYSGPDYTYVTKRPILILDAADYFNF
ncbi:hypothetical protein Xbed_01493 [Xenorhabdus beddingii]|uniref:Uncharacterized protein n=1 Tax=Xenorhabdus beddingii TaxID=40578 RepID=A0A1Y2SQF8_9GAMM|nr:hypothetical protein [Xenorhabdus beddingii]OTA20463.1 hypothetical protein Xbed_01493 [Xenorhabdus beddingii]